MEAISLGAGLAALGFWLFIAVVVIGGIWDGARKREAKHESLRRIIESGQQVATLEGLSSFVAAVSISPDGRHLAATDGSGHAMVWRLPEETRSPAELRALVEERVPFRLDGATLVSIE